MQEIATTLIHWQRMHGRHHLPWQGTRDPYAIWLSEIMLQQTQVTTVIPYYQRFIQRFPDIKSLASGPIDEVLTLWSGLGYYARARHLHQTAQLIINNYDGKFPQHVELIKQLPGIGRSTAAAIAVFAFGKHCAILDGNVKRILTRYFAIDGYPGDPKIASGLWEKATALLPPQNSKNTIEPYTQALMDLGALICTRSKPSCVACPLKQSCAALRKNRVNDLPAVKPRKSSLKKSTVFLIISKQQKILLIKRPAPGIWGGLWCVPEMAENEVASTFCARHYAITIKPVDDMPPFNHSFTHFKLRIRPKLLKVTSGTEVTRKKCQWLTLDETLATAIPAPVTKLVQQIKSDPIIYNKLLDDNG